MYTQTRRDKHSHRYFIDSLTREEVCLCGRVRGEKGSGRTNKYHAQSSIYNGYSYDSKLEAQYAADLDWRVKAGDIRSWEKQVPIRLDVNGHHIKTTKVDFLVHHKDGSKELVETKGMETPDYKLTKKLIEAIFLHENPDYTYTVVKE